MNETAKEALRRKISIIDAAIDEIITKEALGDLIRDYTIDNVHIVKRDTTSLLMTLEKMRSSYIRALKAESTVYVFAR